MIFYLLVSFISVIFFLFVVLQIKGNKDRYPLPKRFSLNKRFVFFSKRYVIISYFAVLAVVTTLTGLVLFSSFID